MPANVSDYKGTMRKYISNDKPIAPTRENMKTAKYPTTKVNVFIIMNLKPDIPIVHQMAAVHGQALDL